MVLQRVENRKKFVKRVIKDLYKEVEFRVSFFPENFPAFLHVINPHTVLYWKSSNGHNGPVGVSQDLAIPILFFLRVICFLNRQVIGESFSITKRVFSY